MSRLVLKPMPEQEEAIEAFLGGSTLRINAFAGTGKTTTLQMLAERSRLKGQYIAFNKDIVQAAQSRFPRSVKSSTSHSLAFRGVVGRFGNSSDKLFSRVNVNATASYLNLAQRGITMTYSLTARQQAFLICETIRRYCQSADIEIVPKHVPRYGVLAVVSDDIVRMVSHYVVEGARRLWRAMIDPSDPYPLGHDGYLKLWALSTPQIKADYILLDEAQDTSDVMLGVLKAQKAQMVYVGDRYQQIYEWRGAVNAMERIETARETALTTSFRFGPELAGFASRVLSFLGEDRKLRGNPQISTSLRRVHQGTFLARTNAVAIMTAVEAIGRGMRPHITGGNGEMLEMLRSVSGLRMGRPSLFPEFFGFGTWGEVQDFSETLEGERLKTFVKLVDTHGEGQLIWALGNTVDEKVCDLVVSTAHRAKGREWDDVILADDFLQDNPERRRRRSGNKEIDAAELRLFYVAVTRSRRALDVPECLREILNGDITVKSEDDAGIAIAAVPQSSGNVISFRKDARSVEDKGAGALPLFA